jgi:hypothetical protein
MGLLVKTHKSKQIAYCLRLCDKKGKSYKYNRKQRRQGYVDYGERCRMYI